MRRLLPVLLCLAVAPVVSGCGSDDVKDLAGGDVAQAAERTAAQKTARMTMTMEMTGMGLPGTVKVDASGITALTEARGTLELALPKELFGESESIEVLFDGAELHARVPEAMASFTGGKRWVKADLAAIAKQLGFDVDGLGALMNPSPAAQLELLRSVKGIKEVAPRHLKGTFTMRDLVAALPAEAKAAMEKLTALAGEEMLDQKQTLEMWLNEDGVAREWRMDMPFTAAPGMPAGHAKMAFKLSDFGVDLKIVPPKPEDTFELTADAVSKLFTS